MSLGNWRGAYPDTLVVSPRDAKLLDVLSDQIAAACAKCGTAHITVFAKRIRWLLKRNDYGLIGEGELGYEYIVRNSVLWRIDGADWQPIGNMHTLARLSDEELYARCRQ